MMPGDDKIVADRLCAVLTNHPKFENPPVSQGELASVAGQWQVTMQFGRGSAEHTVLFEQKGQDLLGTHQGEFISGDLTGSITANQIHFHSSQRIEGQLLTYQFAGTVEGDKMSGNVDMGEYGTARWTAKRHQYENPYGRPRPIKNA
jgi:hypothetical protein